MSSVFNNASYHLGVRAWTGAYLFPSGRLHQGSFSSSNSLRCLQSSGVQILHFRQALSTSAARSTGVEQNQQHEIQRREVKTYIDSNAWWNELRSQCSLSQAFSPPASRSPRVQENAVEGSEENGPQRPSRRAGKGAESHKRTSVTGKQTPYDDENREGHSSKLKNGMSQHESFRKYLEQTPTENVISALQQTYPMLDYQSPPRRHTRRQRSLSQNTLGRTTVRRQKYRSTVAVKRPSRISLQTILADYITTLDTLLSRNRLPEDHDSNHASKVDEALKRVFNDRHLQLLSAKGHSAEDVMAWAWILKANHPSQAALRLLVLAKHYTLQEQNTTKRLPPFITLLLLRRKHLDVRAFRVLLHYSLHILNQQPLPTIASVVGSVSEGSEFKITLPPKRDQPRVAAATAMSMVKLLLYHARHLWPAAQLSIAHSFASFLTHSLAEPNATSEHTLRLNRLRAYYFNACLWLLSIPSKHGPFLSASIQQRAQFELLKAMAAHRPVLPVNRRGYQAVVAVQVAHKKTAAEKQSARYKAASWPPWKEEKLGIDSQRGNEGMRSRAMQVMSQMKEAGYSHTVWEEVASILAGWDTDGSPTIQTRRLTGSPGKLSASAKSRLNDPAIWAARIRATRTVREAWACFLSYQDQGLPPRMRIYYAMAEKLVFRRLAIERNFDRVSLSLPGDGLEVFPEPSSARDVIYVRSEPPSVDDLLKQMLSQGIRPSGRFLALLLGSCTSFRSGLDYLSCSALSTKQVRALCTLWPDRYDPHAMDTIRSLPHYLFLAFIQFLCKFSKFDSLYIAGYDLRMADLFPVVMQDTHVSSTTTLFSYGHVLGEDDQIHHPRALAHAVQLLRTLRPRYTSAWLPLLRALASPRVTVRDRKMRRDVQRFLAWHEVLEVLGWMTKIDVEPGMDGLLILCNAFSHAVAAGIRDPSAAEEGLHIVREALRRRGVLSSSVPRSFEAMVQEGLRLLKTHFDRLVLPVPEISTDADISSGQDAASSIPPMLQVPVPAVLHGFVRALGTAEDYDGLLNLLQWMSRFAPALKEKADELTNGERMMRRTLVAVRVFLEGSWENEVLLRKAAGSAEAVVTSKTESGRQEFPVDQDSKPAFSDPYVEEAYKIIESTEGWGPWPTDEEVRQYLLWHPFAEE
ncbi:hypothetical protein VTN77DRAFT_601 [Rasamsonia byssochlamydoides]|uniref:uncharacterized protein n=1 Tax=Rasamsonia byssochlamydoides TaxID=89139 RepID=UPI0037430EF0